MPTTPHVERHFTGSETVRDIVIGMADGLTVPFCPGGGPFSCRVIHQNYCHREHGGDRGRGHRYGARGLSCRTHRSGALRRAVPCVICETHHIADQPAAEGILATSEQWGCDLIVMGLHGRHGLARLMLGSQVNKVVALSRIPVLVYR